MAPKCITAAVETWWQSETVASYLYAFSYEGCVRMEAASYSSLPEEMMNRVFLAEYDGQPAGIVQLTFHGDK